MIVIIIVLIFIIQCNEGLQEGGHGLAFLLRAGPGIRTPKLHHLNTFAGCTSFGALKRLFDKAHFKVFSQALGHAQILKQIPKKSRNFFLVGLL